MTLTYMTYIKVPELLELQDVQSDPPEHDEFCHFSQAWTDGEVFHFHTWARDE